MSYIISGGLDDGKTFDISFKRCDSNNWGTLHYNPEKMEPQAREEKIIHAHYANDIFWCPDAFDLSFWGLKGDLDSKLLTINFEVDGKEPKLLEDKQILMLINNKKVFVDEESDVPIVKPFTSMHWLPISDKSPILTSLKYTREKVYKAQTEMERFFGTALESEEFLGFRNNDI